ncbi:NAD(P)H-binding protein [Methylobacterium sp. C25]|uniref:NAD(P)-dependent oxidoreductase n=1 Tax=Methylobacterium sp. C25 TaxID=2721622 RepID=UPI001F23D3FA|nr:NAD(P)H-binding protein [Methylobacterium sp. C25]MCE4226660.1 NAD(P)H-binding protein [Methylobacterium sp. C25]
MAHVLVIGASNGVGLETVKAVLGAGHCVRAFARSASTIDFAGPNLETFPGDALLAADIEGALHDVDVVVQALGIPFHAMFKPVTLFSAATNVLVPAMEKAGVRRIISVTGFGTGDSREAIGPLQRLPFRLMFGRAYDDKDAQEMRIRRSGLDWTFVRPGMLTSATRTGRYQVLESASPWHNGMIPRADVADFISRQIESPVYLRKAVVLVA